MYCIYSGYRNIKLIKKLSNNKCINNTKIIYFKFNKCL